MEKGKEKGKSKALRFTGGGELDIVSAPCEIRKSGGGEYYLSMDNGLTIFHLKKNKIIASLDAWLLGRGG